MTGADEFEDEAEKPLLFACEPVMPLPSQPVRHTASTAMPAPTTQEFFTVISRFVGHNRDGCADAKS